MNLPPVVLPRERTALAAIGIGTALFLLLYTRVILAPSGHAPATQDSDFYMYYFPMTEMAFEQLREGMLPVWNPYLFAGMPLLASIEIGVLYPPNWLHLVFSSERAFCLLYVFHVLLAAFGSWKLARGRGRSIEAAVFASLAFAFAAPTILHFDMGMVTVVYSSAWVPLVLALVDRCLARMTAGSACLLALALACQFLAGFPMFTLALAVLIPAWLLTWGVQWRRPLLRGNARVVLYFAATASLALALIMPQLLPTLRYLNQAHRADLDYQQSTHCCFPAPNLITLLVPGFFGDNKACGYWGETFLFDANAFCGTVTILLALIAARRWKSREFRFWFATVVVVLAFALGKYSWFYDFCYQFVPGVDRFRGVSRLSIFAILGVSQLAALGLDEVIRDSSHRAGRRLCLASGAVALGVLCCAFLGWRDSDTPPPFWQEFFDWIRRPGTELFTTITADHRTHALAQSYKVMLRGVAFCMFTVAAASLIVAWRGNWKRLPSVSGLLLIALLAGELFVFESKYVVLMDTEPWRAISRKVRAAIPDDDESFRIAGFSANPPLAPNRFLYGRLQSVGGHENFVLHRYSAFLSFWAGIDPKWQTNLTIPNYGRIYDLLNVKYFLTPPEVAELEPGDELLQENVFEFGGRRFALYRNANYLPRFSLVHQARVVPDLMSAAPYLESLFQGHVEVDTIVETERPIELNSVDENQLSLEKVAIVEHRPGRIVADVTCVAPALLLCSTNYYPAWEAIIDGQPAPILPANIFMRAVPIPAGKHRVEMTFRSMGFAAGCRFAAVSLVCMLTVAVHSICVNCCRGNERRP